MPKKPYRKDYPKRMYSFFLTYDDEAGAPSFSKFARCVGLTPEDLTAFRSHSEFDRAYLCCIELRNDYLIDRALIKRFDPSFVKFLLTEGKEETEDRELSVTVETVP